jgi:hypothetical protein
MKKLFLSLICILTTLLVSAQDADTPEAPKEAWSRGGNVSVLFNQSAFNAEWLGGGTSNIAGNFSLNYDFNYKKGDWTWDNKLLAAYGLTKIKGADFVTKSDDRFEFNSLAGKKAGGNWYYSAFANLRTQMDAGFIVNDDGTRTKRTHFFSPGYIQIGPGMLYKKSDNLKVNIAPATARLIIVHGEFTENLIAGEAYFGVEPGKTSRFEFGASVGAYYKANIMPNVSIENILNLYSNYIEKPQNVDLDYTMNLVMSINKYLSANVAFQAIYDDNAVQAVQIREVFGLGVNFGF